MYCLGNDVEKLHVQYNLIFSQISYSWLNLDYRSHIYFAYQSLSLPTPTPSFLPILRQVFILELTI